MKTMQLTAATPELRETFPSDFFLPTGIMSQHVREGDVIVLRDKAAPGIARDCVVQHVNAHGQGTFRAYTIIVEHNNANVDGQEVSAITVGRNVMIEAYA